MEPQSLLLCTAPSWVAIIIGLKLILKASGDDLTRMAGWLTLKPVLTTPIWFAILVALGDSPIPFVPACISILPGVALTSVAAIVFWPTLCDPRARGARLLLVLDCLRWMNTFLLTLTGFLGSPYGLTDTGTFVCHSALLGLAMPTVFALVAYFVATSGRAPGKPIPEKADGQGPPSPAKAEREKPSSMPRDARAGRAFWLQWVSANIVGRAVSPMLGRFLGGAPVGGAQWLVLRQRIRGRDWWFWILASIVGAAVAPLLERGVATLNGAMGGPLTWIVISTASATVGGYIAGVMQWSVLRRQVRHAGWWVLASVAGWTAGAAIRTTIAAVVLGGFADRSGSAGIWDATWTATGEIPFLSSTVSGGISGAVDGAITGASLNWLLRHPIQFNKHNNDDLRIPVARRFP
jgi:hypothetical protein